MIVYIISPPFKSRRFATAKHNIVLIIVLLDHWTGPALGVGLCLFMGTSLWPDVVWVLVHATIIIRDARGAGAGLRDTQFDFATAIIVLGAGARRTGQASPPAVECVGIESVAGWDVGHGADTADADVGGDCRDKIHVVIAVMKVGLTTYMVVFVRATDCVTAVNCSILNVEEVSIWDWLVSELVDGGVSPEVVVFGFDENDARGGVVVTRELQDWNGHAVTVRNAPVRVEGT